MQHIIEILTNTHVDIVTAVVGIVVALLTQGVKKINAIPISEGQTARIRTVAVVLSFAGTFAATWANGDLASANFTQYLAVVAQSVVAYFFAHTTYKSVIKDPNK